MTEQAFESPPFDLVMARAMQWAAESGWPTREDDLAVMAEAWVAVCLAQPGLTPFERGERLLGELAEAFGGGDEGFNRALLCRLVLRASGMDE